MKINSLCKNEILRGNKQFYSLFRHGKSISGEYVKIIYIKKDCFRIGFSVSKKIKGKVKINYLRRSLKEVYRTNKQLFLGKINLIIIQKKMHLKFLDLKDDILETVQLIINLL